MADVITEELADFADDFCRRIRDLPWWAGALFIAGSSPVGEGSVRRTGLRKGRPPLVVTSQTVREGRTWADVPAFQVVD